MRKLNLQTIEQDIRDIIQDVRTEIDKMGGIGPDGKYNPIDDDVRHFMTTSVYPIHKYLLSGDIQSAKDLCKLLISDVGEHAADEDNHFGYGFIMIGRIHDYLSRAIEQLEAEPIDKPNGLSVLPDSQSVLALYYFLRTCNIEPRIDIDIAPIAKFLHLATGKEFTTIQNSNFYKLMQKAPNHIGDKKLIDDLSAVRSLFERVEIPQAVKMVNNEIERCYTELKHSNKI